MSFSNQWTQRVFPKLEKDGFQSRQSGAYSNYSLENGRSLGLSKEIRQEVQGSIC